MKKLIFLLIAVFFIGCTSFEIVNEIQPEITIVGDTVGLRYKLGNLLISDTWLEVEEQKIAFFEYQK